MESLSDYGIRIIVFEIIRVIRKVTYLYFAFIVTRCLAFLQERERESDKVRTQLGIIQNCMSVEMSVFKSWFASGIYCAGFRVIGP